MLHLYYQIQILKVFTEVFVKCLDTGTTLKYSYL